jgi:glycopeptide antibiotics resistance protein
MEVIMQRSSISFTTLIILFSIITELAQFAAYYFLGPTVFVYCLAAFICFLFSHVFLEKTLSFEACFSYSLLNVFMCAIILALSYFGGTDSLLKYQPNLILFIILNWLVPLLYCVIRNLGDRALKYSDFNRFYRNTNLIFIFFYIGLFLFLLFFKNKTFVGYYTDIDTINLIPFFTIATLIENYINGSLTLGAVIKYIVYDTALFLPYGFYAVLLLRYQGRLIRFLVLLFLPALVEILQQVFSLGKCDLDDVLLGLLGGFIGAVLYHIVNRIYCFFTEEDFLYNRPHYSFSGRSLHF